MSHLNENNIGDLVKKVTSDPSIRKIFIDKPLFFKEKLKNFITHWSNLHGDDDNIMNDYQDFKYYLQDLLKKEQVNEIESSDVDTNSIEYHDTLNPIIFDDNDQINKEFREAILKIVSAYVKTMDLPSNTKIKDIVFTGSMANYNYNKDSDIDVHILVDYNQLGGNKDVLMDYFLTKKNDWSEKYDITYKGFPVELFVQDAEEPKSWTAVYSVLNNKWVQKPVKDSSTNIDKNKIADKVRDFANKIDQLVIISNSKDHNMNQITKDVSLIKDQLRKMRQASLESNGELGEDNLVYKLLRSSGYLNKLDKIKIQELNKDLTVNELKSDN